MIASKGIEQHIYLNLLNKTYCFIKKGLSIIMLLPLLLLFFNNTAFRHQHVLPDGTVIEHAHFHRSDSEDSKNNADHEHADKEFLLFALISDSPVIVATSCSLTDVIIFQEADLIIGQVQNLSFNYFDSPYSLRAPPHTSPSIS